MKNENISELCNEVIKLKDQFLSFEINHVLRVSTINSSLFASLTMLFSCFLYIIVGKIYTFGPKVWFRLHLGPSVRFSVNYKVDMTSTFFQNSFSHSFNH